MVAPRRRGNPVVPRSAVRVYRNPVVTTVTARPSVARRWVHTTLWRHRRQRLYSADGDGLTVGLGVQWTPPFRKLSPGAEPRPGTLQLCAGNSCLVFKIARAGGVVPRILRRFLADARVTFAAYNVASDCRKLRAHHGIEVASTLELRSAGDGLGNAPMAEMANRLLGIPRGRVEKPRWIATSEWDGRRLSWGQVRYAAADAYLSCRLGERIRRRSRRGVHVVEIGDEYESSDGDEYVESRELEPADDDDVDDGRWTDRFVGFIGGWVQDEEDRYRLDEYENNTCLPYQTPAFVIY
ncbi:uncharacterized protein [Miscanthus floridulus]|uniref:uncharacterized protein n=1 Tax=Miscanthus floridulus TaxID=154761 RepID=UPI003458653B